MKPRQRGGSAPPKRPCSRSSSRSQIPRRGCLSLTSRRSQHARRRTRHRRHTHVLNGPDLWMEANSRETQAGRMRLGDPVPILFSKGTASLSQNDANRQCRLRARVAFFLRRRPRIPFDAIGRRRAEPAFDRGNGLRRGLAETHTEPHPTFGDVVSGQAAVPHRRVESASYPARRDRQKTPSLRGVSVARFATSVALLPAYVPDPAGNVLVLIDGRSSSCLPGSPAPLP